MERLTPPPKSDPHGMLSRRWKRLVIPPCAFSRPTMIVTSLYLGTPRKSSAGSVTELVSSASLLLTPPAIIGGGTSTEFFGESPNHQLLQNVCRVRRRDSSRVAWILSSLFTTSISWLAYHMLCLESAQDSLNAFFCRILLDSSVFRLRYQGEPFVGG